MNPAEPVTSIFFPEFFLLCMIDIVLNLPCEISRGEAGVAGDEDFHGKAIGLGMGT